MAWEEDLQEASFAGVEFPVATRKKSGGRARARRRYPNRPGQSIEDQGREPVTYSLEIPLFASVDSSHYPGVAQRLFAAFDDPETAGIAEYVDPEDGPIQAAVISHNWVSAADERDGGRLTLELEEVTFDDQVLVLRSG